MKIPNLCDPMDCSPPGSSVHRDSLGKNTGVDCHFLLQCMKGKVKVKSLSCVWPSATPWTAAYQAPPSMGFSRQEYWSGVPLPSCYHSLIKTSSGSYSGYQISSYFFRLSTSHVTEPAHGRTLALCEKRHMLTVWCCTDTVLGIKGYWMLYQNS